MPTSSTHVASAAGPLPQSGGCYLINPRWKAREALPARMFHGKHRPTLASAYDDAYAGVPILDTLLDAFAFFDGLAPSLARRHEDGSLEGFPLPPYDFALRYRRLAPDWPTERVWNGRAWLVAQAGPPHGSRTIVGRITVSGRVILCGDTIAGAGRTQAFTELAEQVVLAPGPPPSCSATGCRPAPGSPSSSVAATSPR